MKHRQIKNTLFSSSNASNDIDETTAAIIELFRKKNEINTSSSQMKIILSSLCKNLKKNINFSNFVLYNNIDDFALKNAIRSFEYECYKSNIPLFSQGEMSSKFYGIIKGSISFRYLNNFTKQETEQFVYNDGMCFGEWAALYDKRRTLSAVTKTECHLFSMEKEIFKSVLGKYLLEAEKQRKEFIYKTLPIFNSCISYKVDEIIKRNIFPKFYRRGDVIYYENDISESLYILYLGEAKLVLDINKAISSSLINIKEPTDNILRYIPTTQGLYDEYFAKMKQEKEVKEDNAVEEKGKIRNTTTIIKMKQGDIGGIETVAMLGKMRSAMIASSEFVAVMKVELSSLNDYRTELCKSLLPLYVEKEKIFVKKLTKIKSLRDELKKKMKESNKSKRNTFSTIDYGDIADNYYVYRERLNKQFEVNKIGFVLKNKRNYSLFNKRESLDHANKKNEEIAKKINVFLHEKKHITPHNEFKKGIKKIMKRSQSQSFLQPKEKVKQLEETTATSFFLTAQEKKKKQKEQIMNMFNRIIDKKLLKGGEVFLGLNLHGDKNEKKAQTPVFSSLHRTRSARDIIFKDKFVECNYKFNSFFNRHINSARCLSVKNKKSTTIYNSGSFDMPFASILSK